MTKFEAMLLFCIAGLVVKNTGEYVEDYLDKASEYADGVMEETESKNHN